MAAANSGLGGGKSKNSTDLTMQQQTYQNRPIRPMKLFTEWDVENAAPNCIPRSCCLRIVRLQVFRALEQQLKAVVICVSMQGSRRSLRSDQIPVQPSGSLDVDVDLVFTLQYPHFLKRRRNSLQIMLQRRKKYKTRTILGYKTLAVGEINMAQVLQGWYSQQLNIYTKDETSPAATLTIATLSSDPIDREIQDRRSTIVSINDNFNNSSDDEGDDDSSSSEIEDSAGEMDSAREMQKSRNFKQKILRVLFKRLKNADLGDVQQELQDHLQDDIGVVDSLSDEEDYSDNDDLLEDNTSIASAQRPGLRPFFDHTKSQTTLNQSTLTKDEANELSLAVSNALSGTDTNTDENNDMHSDNETIQKKKEVLSINSNENDSATEDDNDLERSSSASSKGQPRSISFRIRRGDKVQIKRKSSVDLNEPIKEKLMSGFNDQLAAVLGADDKIPDYILMIGLKDEADQHLALKLMSRLAPVICTSCALDVEAAIAAVANKYQKFSNRHSVAPPTIRIGIIGTESYLRIAVKSYIDQFSQKPQEYQNYVKFLVIPSGSHKVASYIATKDKSYNALFMDSFWKVVFDQRFLPEADLREVERRILQYVDNAVSNCSLPIAEALITCRLSDGDSSQFFIPFTTDVRIGPSDVGYIPDSDDTGFTNNAASSKETTKENVERPVKDSQQQNSPRTDSIDQTKSTSNQMSINETTLDLVVDYWPLSSASKKDDKKEVNKLSVKSTFRSLSVQRLPSFEHEDTTGLNFVANLKSSNRNKVKRLMKSRDKDAEGKSSISVLVNKIVCTSRSNGQTFNVWIDGKEWTNVKFFSLSSQWPTHIKQFPLGMCLNHPKQAF